MGSAYANGSRAFGLIVVCFLLSCNFRELGFESAIGVGAVRALGILSVLWAFRKSVREKFDRWRGSPPISFPHLTTQGLAAASAKALPIYFVLTAAVLAPMLPRFFSHFYADGGDGLQMVWNVWWFKTALFSGTSPFYSDYLHFPSGTTLWGASYHPLKNLLAAPLVPLIGLVPAYNVLVVGTLVGCSLSAFALSFVISRSFLGSLAAGFVFGFWNNRIAHLNGHLHTVSAELVPLFLLCLLLWLSKPTIRRSFWLSALLLGSLFLDHYGFLFNVFVLGVTSGWAIVRQKGIRFLFQAPYLWPLAFFATMTAATSGTLAFFILRLSRTDPWGGAHAPRENSMDLFAPFIPGAYSWMAAGTKGYWSHILSGEIEGSIYPGLTVLVLCVLCYRSLRTPWVGLLAVLAVFFWTLALGPYLQIWGHETPLSLPYQFLQKALPFLRMSGVPVRFAQVGVLACSVLVALYFSTLNKKKVIALVICLLAVDLFPKLPATTAPEIPKFVTFLKDLPDKPAIVDASSYMTTSLYYQTVHEKPMAFGYVARVPLSRQEAESRLRQAIVQNEWPKLKTAGFSYLVLPSTTPTNLPIAYQDETTTIYSLKN